MGWWLASKPDQAAPRGSGQGLGVHAPKTKTGVTRPSATCEAGRASSDGERGHVGGTARQEARRMHRSGAPTVATTATAQDSNNGYREQMQALVE